MFVMCMQDFSMHRARRFLSIAANLIECGVTDFAWPLECRNGDSCRSGCPWYVVENSHGCGQRQKKARIKIPIDPHRQFVRVKKLFRLAIHPSPLSQVENQRHPARHQDQKVTLPLTLNSDDQRQTHIQTICSDFMINGIIDTQRYASSWSLRPPRPPP